MKLIICAPVTKCNGWFLSKWIRHFNKYPAEKIVLMIESINEPEYRELIKNSKVEAHFYGDAFGGNKIRVRLMKEVFKHNPDWVLLTHDDEIFEDKMLIEINNLMNHPTFRWYRFPLYHFYNSMTHYRNDGIWKGGMMDVMRLWNAKCMDKYEFGGPGQVWHVQSAPNDINQFPGIRTDIRVKHFGHANPKASMAKRAERGDKWGKWTDEKLELVEWKE